MTILRKKTAIKAARLKTDRMPEGNVSKYRRRRGFPCASFVPRKEKRESEERAG